MAWYVQLKPDGLVGVFYYEHYNRRITKNFEAGDFSDYMRCGNARQFGVYTLKEFKDRFVTGRDPVYIFNEDDGVWYMATLLSKPEPFNMKALL